MSDCEIDYQDDDICDQRQFYKPQKYRARGRGRGKQKKQQSLTDLAETQAPNTQKSGRGRGRKKKADQSLDDTQPSQKSNKRQKKAEQEEEPEYPELGQEAEYNGTQKINRTQAEQKAFWRQYWKDKHRKQVQEESPVAKEGKGGWWRGKRTPWNPKNGYKLNDIQYIHKHKQYDLQQMQKEDAEEESDLVITPLAAESASKTKSKNKKLEKRRKKAGAAPSNTGDKDMQIDDSQASYASNFSTSTVTFTNTTAFGKMIQSGFQSRGVTPDDDPKNVKYSKGYGSVKGLHYRKYIGLEMLTENNFALTFHKFFSNEIKNLIRSIENSRFSPEMRTWVLSILKYDQLMEDLKQICIVNQIHIEDIPQFAMTLMKTKIPYTVSCQQVEDLKRYDYVSDKSCSLKLEEFLPPHIFKNLHSFQRDGIKKGLKLYGRVLINDDFGTGKSLQGLALALAYRLEWPLVIFCPSFAKFTWRYEILKWLPGFDIQRIQVLQHEREDLRPGASILIVTFELAVKMIWRLQQLQLRVCIVDEADWFGKGLTNMDKIPKIQQNLMKVVHNMKRVILLSGLNVIRQPAKLHPLARILRPDCIPGFYEFGYRYTDPRHSFEGIDFTNAGNLTELKQLLEKRLYHCSRRRHIYQDLPQRMYQKWEVTADVNIVIKIQKQLKQYIQPWEEHMLAADPHNHKGFFYEMFFKYYSCDELHKNPDLVKFLTTPIDESVPSFQKTLKQIFRDLFDLTGQAKVKAVFEIIESLLNQGSCTRKIILCAFHTSFLTSLEDFMATKQIEALYIGRNVSPENSSKICQKFCQVPEYRALIIDTSCIDFTQHFFFLKDQFPYGIPVVFAESLWTLPRFVEPKQVTVEPNLDHRNETEADEYGPEFLVPFEQSESVALESRQDTQRFESSMMNTAQNLGGNDFSTQQIGNSEFQSEYGGNRNSAETQDLRQRDSYSETVTQMAYPGAMPFETFEQMNPENVASLDRAMKLGETDQPLAQLSSVLPDHSNLIFIYGRYTLDEIIFKALYEQDRLLYEALEPLEIHEQQQQPSSQSEVGLDELQNTKFNYILQEKQQLGKSGSAFLSLNYDELPPEQLRINKANREIILQYQKHQRALMNFSLNGGQEDNPADMLPDDYLIQVFDPLAPTKFIDPHASDKGTRDLNKPQLVLQGDKEARNLTKIQIPGTKTTAPTKTVTLENMFTKQIEKAMLNPEDCEHMPSQMEQQASQQEELAISEEMPEEIDEGDLQDVLTQNSEQMQDERKEEMTKQWDMQNDAGNDAFPSQHSHSQDSFKEPQYQDKSANDKSDSDIEEPLTSKADSNKCSEVSECKQSKLDTFKTNQIPIQPTQSIEVNNREESIEDSDEDRPPARMQVQRVVRDHPPDRFSSSSVDDQE